MSIKIRLLIMLLSAGVIAYGAIVESKIIVLGFIIFFVTMFMPGVLKEIKLGLRDADILKGGVVAKAELLEISPRSGGNELSPGVTIKAKVFYSDNTTGIVAIEDCISTVRLAQYVPGFVMDVKYDPRDRNKVVLVQKI